MQKLFPDVYIFHSMSQFLAKIRICLPNVRIYLLFNIDSQLLEVMNFV